MTNYSDNALTPVLARHITSTFFEDFTPHTIMAGQRIITDCIGAMIGGLAEPDIKALISQFNLQETGPSIILGQAQRTDHQTAAFIHGTAGTVLEMDEGHQFAKGHPGMHVLPALLAATADRNLSGREFLRAFILGYDVAARIGQATALRPAMHPHGTWGGIGATAALAALENLSADATAELMNIASSLTLATSRKTMLEGGTVRNAYTGMANQMAHLSLTLLNSGFTGEADGIASVFGKVVADEFDHASALDALGQRFEVTRNYFKLHACCRYNHAALDALIELMADNPALNTPEDIRQINVESYNLAAELSDPAPKNVLACKFSIPFAMATTLYHRSSDVLSFTEDARRNPDIRSLCRKVTIAENPQMTAQLPDLRPAKVVITMTNGDRFEKSVTTNRGDWQDPYQDSDLKVKFISLSTRIWPAEKSERVYTMLMNIQNEQMDDLLAELAT